MRLHRLSITAFGPFADQVDVDFDHLSESGLFLLTGATGAGKTSVLDAVCFALYGQVPGDRAGAKHLRSDHAAPHRAPEVVLRLSIGERQFTFTRSPAWMRPKLRGSGETKVQAHVLVEELVDGSWTVLTNRLDDAGLLVTDLLGMTASQFTQVALLPQGRFQAFLRASSAERHSVLQQLFRTDRFERIEDWLVARRASSRRAAEAAAREVGELINRFLEASGTDVGTDADAAWLGDLGQAAESGDLERWTDQVIASAGNQEAEAAEAGARADLHVARTAQQLEAAERTSSLQARARAAQRDLDRWSARSVEVASARSRLEEHHRALPLTELAGARAAAERKVHRAEQHWEEQRREVSELLSEDCSHEDLVRAQRAAHDAVALAVGFAPRAAALQEARHQVAVATTRLQRVESGVAQLELTLSRQPGIIADAVAAVHEARAAAARLPVVLGQVERLGAAVAAIRRAEVVGLELAVARTDVLAATETAHAAREHYLDLREARINGMASELAGQLASGCGCPVCGSATHPAPAIRSTQAVGRSEEEAARKRFEDAEFELHTRTSGVATLEAELARLDEQLAAVDRGKAADQLLQAQDESERLAPLVAALDVLVDREATCRHDHEAAEAELRAALLERADLRAQADQAGATIGTLEDEWAVLLDGQADRSDLEDLVTALAGVLEQRRLRARLLDAARSALDSFLATAAQSEDLAGQLEEAAQNAGFTGTSAALAALLDAEELNQLTDLVTAAESEMTAAASTLELPEITEAIAADPPELSALQQAHSDAVGLARRAASSHAAATARLRRLEELRDVLARRTEVWRPLAEEYRTVSELTAFVEGKSTDNALRIRLAAYVLAERLRQVVDAANERLTTMTDQRYALEHSDDRGVGEQRGGLSLRVRDDWNGVHRDPATLSGGETFVVSLALALGLADTVAHEAGGTDIDTLFIDEGFGSLDADTLEDVMDTLDTLRDGGRVVGLVSHVPELRSRIPTQLEVTKGRTGSSLRTVLGQR